MCSYPLVLLAIIFLQDAGADHQINSHLFKRSPQQFDIQSISQKQLTPEITVVDVVVNEPARRGYQNQYIQPVRQQPAYPGSGNFYPNIQYQNIPNRRQPEIQIIEVVDPRPNAGNNYQQRPRYPQGGQIYPNTNGGIYQNPNNQYPRGNGQFMNNGNGGPRRPYRPNSDFFIQEVNEDDDSPPRRPPHHRRPGHRGHHRPRPPRPNENGENESSEEEKYVFDAGEDTVAGYTPDNFPIIPLHKNDIRR